jgi:asparagine synthase (glutamine-hydrolysing)
VRETVRREILPAALLDRPRGYFPVPALRLPDEPYLTMLRVALYPPKAKEPELLQPQSVEILRSRPNDHRTRTGANSFWVLRVLEMYLQAHGVS